MRLNLTQGSVPSVADTSDDWNDQTQLMKLNSWQYLQFSMANASFFHYTAVQFFEEMNSTMMVCHDECTELERALRLKRIANSYMFMVICCLWFML